MRERLGCGHEVEKVILERERERDLVVGHEVEKVILEREVCL